MKYTLLIEDEPNTAIDFKSIIINGQRYGIDKDATNVTRSSYTDAWGELEIPLKLEKSE